MTTICELRVQAQQQRTNNQNVQVNPHCPTLESNDDYIGRGLGLELGLGFALGLGLGLGLYG